jgi:hypothetical protein
MNPGHEGFLKSVGVLALVEKRLGGAENVDLPPVLEVLEEVGETEPEDTKRPELVPGAVLYGLKPSLSSSSGTNAEAAN